MKIFPSYQEFIKLAEHHTTIPVYAKLNTDLETPVSIYYKLVGDGKGFMLESAESGSSFGRYSFIGSQPFAYFSARPEHSEVITNDNIIRIEGKPLSALQEYLSTFSVAKLSPILPFSGGAVGYFSYETVGTWERNRCLDLPEDMLLAELMFCKVLITLDHLYHTTTVVYLAAMEDGKTPKECYEQAIVKIKETALTLKQNLAFSQEEVTYENNQDEEGLETERDLQQKYIDMVVKAKEYIVAGDIFQVVLSQKYQCNLKCPPFLVYRRLRQLNPSPYMFYFNFGNRQVVGASPEMLVKVQNNKVETCPIAGTRPRGKNDEEDNKQATELLADIKERAEHAMLVDLGRNDIGRVSMPGTVEVEQMMQVEMFSHVMHLVSRVSGKLDSQYTPLNALAACFPAGTLSGAPKVRAMEIISELEKDYRGPYGGAVGYIDFQGNMDTCITIRTMVVEGRKATIQTGAGIVADSVPEKEYEEIRHKARALFQVLEEAEH